MKRRFVPTPYDALALCSSNAARLAVFTLYERAHSHQWRPLRMSVRQFASGGELRVESAMRLLEDLKAAGMIRWERPTARAVASLITVFDPTSSPEHEDDGPAEHRSERKTAGLTQGFTAGRTGKWNMQDNGSGTPSCARVEDTRAQNQTIPNQETNAATPRAKGAPSKEGHESATAAQERVATCRALAQSVGIPLEPDDEQAIVASPFTIDDLVLIWQWAHQAPDPEAEIARDGNPRWAHWWRSLLKPPKVQSRLEKARRWATTEHVPAVRMGARRPSPEKRGESAQGRIARDIQGVIERALQPKRPDGLHIINVEDEHGN